MCRLGVGAGSKGAGGRRRLRSGLRPPPPAPLLELQRLGTPSLPALGSPSVEWAHQPLPQGVRLLGAYVCLDGRVDSDTQ